MTTNQTIDGVPRDLLDRIFRHLFVEPALNRDDGKKLRALLDAPAVKPRPFGYWLTPKTCAGLAMFQRELIEDPVLTASVVEYFHVTPLYDTPGSQPQGVPVAWIGCKHKLPDEGEHVLVKYATLEGLEIVHGAKRHRLFDDMDHLFWVNDRGESMRGEVSAWIPMSRLLGVPAEHPAPVSVAHTCDCNQGRLDCNRRCKP